MTDSLKLVPIRVADISAIIVWMIMGAEARCAFIGSTVSKRCGVEGIYRFARVRNKGNVRAVPEGRGLPVKCRTDKQLGTNGFTPGGAFFALHEHG